MTASPKQSLGQHFLTDRNMIAKIIRNIDPQRNDRMIEIGPGRGALTLPLLQSGCSLTCIELDTALASGWRELEKHYHKFRCVEANALELDWRPYLPCDKCVGNIPYNISRPLMYKLYLHRRDISVAVLMVQKEFADKLIAGPGSGSYGILSVLTQIFCSVKHLFTIPPSVFYPPPKVHSVCVQLTFQKDRLDDDFIIECVQTAFNQRRKTLQNSLKKFYRSELKESFPWHERADGLAPEAYLRLVEILRS